MPLPSYADIQAARATIRAIASDADLHAACDLLMTHGTAQDYTEADAVLHTLPDDTPDFEPETLPLVSVFALIGAVLVLVFGAGVMVGGWW